MSESTALTALYRSGDGVVVDAPDPQTLQTALADPKGLLWADLHIDRDADGALLRDVFHFHPLTIGTLISGIYGMNLVAGFWPPSDSEWGFGAVVAFMVVIAVLTLAFFRLRRWI